MEKRFCFWLSVVKDKRLLKAGILVFLLSCISILTSARVFAVSEAYLNVDQAGLVSADIIPGVFNYGSETITVETNNYSGYTMATAVGGSTSLVNTNQGSTSFIPVIVLPADKESITAGDFHASSWGLSLNGVDYIPLNNEMIIRSASNHGNDSFELSAGAFVGIDIEAGVYEQTIALLTVANPPVISITYYKNTTDEVLNMPEQDEFILSGSVVSVSSKIPSREGYDFIGWAESNTAYGSDTESYYDLDPTLPLVKNLYAVWEPHCVGICYDKNADDAAGEMDSQGVNAGAEVTLWASNFSRPSYGFAGWNTRPDGAGANYGPNETITMSSTGRLWLYANWVAPDQNYTMQTFDKTIEPYSSYDVGKIIALRDERDNQVYSVAKLADGEWWMIENLRLNPADENTTINRANTNNPTNVFINDVATNYKGSTEASNFWKTCNVDYYSSCIEQVSFGLGNINRENEASYNANRQSAQWYSYGVMYNWYTATGGNGTYQTSRIAEGDICPSGWHLPTGTGAGEIGLLSNALGGYKDENNVAQTMRASTVPTGASMSQTLRSYPNNFLYSGYYYESSASHRGTGGHYAAPNYYGKCSLVFTGSAVYPGCSSAGSNRYEGYAVRCMANDYHTYTLYYDSMGGQTVPAEQSSEEMTRNSYVFTISDEIPTRNGYNFIGWTLTQDATVPDYQPGDEIIATGATTRLYAIWQRQEITYHGNGDDGTGTMGVQPISANQDIVLLAPNFSRPGYGFAGWNTEPDGSGTTYGPNQTIPMPDGGLLDLYAKWIAAEPDVTFQTFDRTEPSYTNAAIGTVIALRDERDNQVYAVAKLADGNWWMVENLRLNPADSNTVIDITNTNNPTTEFVADINANYKGNEDVSSYWTYVNDRVAFNTNNINRDYTAASATAATSNLSWYSYGVYYNWYTATAGNGYSNLVDSSAVGDICPSGWHLSAGRTWGEFYNLLTLYGVESENYTEWSNPTAAEMSEILRSYPNNFVLSGIQLENGRNDRGGAGYYWSSTTNRSATSTNQNRSLMFISRAYMRTESLYGNYGMMVRCIANSEETYSLSYSGDGENIPEGQTITSSQRPQMFVVSETVPTREGYNFLGWSSRKVLYQPGDIIYTVDNEIELKASWERQRIKYYRNDGSTSSGSRDVVANDSVVLISPNYRREGYGFAGWNTEPDGSGASYGPNETITIPDNGLLDLYAIWVPAEEGVTMQTFDMTIEPYASATTNTVIALYDERDNQAYAVAKLADGNWWMIENLHFKFSTHGDQLNSDNTNNPTASFVELASTNPSQPATNSWCPGSECESSIVYKIEYEGYYSWFTATAGNGTLAENDSTAAGDICPSGWHLPTGLDNGEFGILSYSLSQGSSDAVASANLRSYPNNFTYAGVRQGSSSGSGTNGYYLTSTTHMMQSQYQKTYTLRIDKNGVSYMQQSGNGGESVRCIINSPITYSLQFDANGGQNPPATQTGTNTHRMQKFTISNDAPSRSDYNFAGWSTSQDSSSAEYQPGDEIIVRDSEATVTLYAVWEEN